MHALFLGLPCEITKSLQMVQNATTRVLTHTRTFDDITPIIASLHWLPNNFRSDLKELLMTYKTTHGIALSYVSDLIIQYIPPCVLHSQNSGLLTVPRVTYQPTSDNLALLTPLELNSKCTSLT